MKKILRLTALFVLIVFSARGQNYELEVLQEPYKEIDSLDYIGYLFGDLYFYDDGGYYKSYDFPFKLFSATYSNTLVEANGSFEFDGEDAVRAVGTDLVNMSHSHSHIIYNIASGPDGKIFQVQWRDAGFKLDQQEKDYINFQIWIYENTNVVEFRYGRSQVSNLGFFDNHFPIAGVTDATGQKNFYLSGPADNPSLVNAGPDVAHLNAFPDSGTVYRFTPTNKALSLTSPNGGESWEAGSSKNITWASKDISSVDLSYSTDDGQNWTSIESNVAAAGSYTWTVSNEATAKARIKITENGGTYSDISDEAFTITAPQPLLKILTPNGGEKWAVESQQDITWDSKLVNLVTIEYSIDNGATWEKIDQGISAALKLYKWKVPKTVSKQALVRLTDLNDPSRNSISSGTFEIATPPSSSITETDDVLPDLIIAGKKVLYTMQGSDHATLTVYDASARILCDKHIDQPTGSIDLRRLPAGIYIIRLYASGRVLYQKVLLK